MLHDLLAVAAENAAEYPKYIPASEAALYAILGFLVVFAGIALLIFVVWAIGRLMPNAKGQPKTQPIVKETKQETVATDVEEISEETVAVITAALMAYYQKNNPQCGFIVKRIKRM